MIFPVLVCLLVLSATMAPQAEANPKHYLIQTADGPGAGGLGGSDSDPSLADLGAPAGKGKGKKKGEDFF